jgi:hypothetical protein
MTTYTSEPGTKLGGRYRLEDRIAAGSGWAAWKAIDETLARAVTVFTFAQGFPRVTEVVTAARAASRLTDPRLAQVFDVEDAWDRAYIVMEWAAGDTLGDLIADGPLEPARGAQMIAEAAAALSSAHAAGVAHMCLSPGSVRWSQTGEVKVVGLGIDAALAGVAVDDPVLTDTRGLGRLLYAALTGCWPGGDYPALPAAPLADGQPISPRNVVAGVPDTFSDLACRAMQLPSREGQPPVLSPAELSRELMAAIPPAPVPLAPPPPVRRADPVDYQADPYWPGRDGGWHDPDSYRSDWPRGEAGQAATGWSRQQGPYSPTGPGWSTDDQRLHAEDQGRSPTRTGHRAPAGRGRDYAGQQAQAGGSHGRRDQRVIPFIDGTRPPVRVLAAVGALVVVAAIAAFTFWPSGNVPAKTGAQRAGHSTPATTVATLTPVKATGFDPLTPTDTDNENTKYASAAIDSNPRTAWMSQWYKSAEFGGLKSGVGLLVEMPKAETYRTVTVNFGTTTPGSDVKLLIGNSDTRSAANLASMKTVGAANAVSGKVTFHIKSSATGRFLIVWFSTLPPCASNVCPSSGHWYMAEVFNVSIKGLS